MYTNASSNVTVNQESTTPGMYAPYEHHVINADNFHFYGVGIVIPFGLIGNLFSICIFLLSPILRSTTTGQYLVALAIADTTVLVGEMIRWFSDYTEIAPPYYYLPESLRVYETTIAACRISYFLRYGGDLWSVWLTIAIAVERLIAVAFPLKISQISTLRRSRIVIFIIAIISFGLALFTFWHFEIRGTIEEPQCKIVEVRNNDYNIWNTVIIKFGTLIIPGVLIAIITVIIIVLLYRARQKRMSQLAVTVQGPRKQWSNSGLSTETQLTLMLVAVCVATIALRAPYTFAYYFFTQCNYKTCSSLTRTQIHVASRVTEVFNIINYAINFILYCLSGSSFREQIKMTFCRGNKPGCIGGTQQISLETPPTPQLGSNNRLLKVTPRASPSAQTDNI